LKDLEKLIDRACRELPVLGAPATLAGRILAEIERRAALPWWRRSFAHWPAGARAVFLGMCIAVILVTLSLPLTAALSTVHAPVTWALHTGATVFLLHTVLGHVGGDLAHSVSPVWLHGAGLGICALYVLFAGLCATTYRTLYVNR
jgi:hypothetical protein